MNTTEREIKKLLKGSKLTDEQIEILLKDEAFKKIYKMAKQDAQKYLKIRMIQGLQIYQNTLEIINQAVRSNRRPTGQSEDGNEAER